MISEKGQLFWKGGRVRKCGGLRLQMEAMIPTSSAPTTLWEDRYGSLILIMEPQKSELRSKQLVKISGKIGFGLSPAVIFSSECR